MKKDRPRTPRFPAPDLSMDAVDAAGLFGALAGGLSIVLPYFDGLTLALSALGAGAAVVRTGGKLGVPRGRWPRPVVVGVLVILVGAGIFLLAPPLLVQVRGLLLGVAGLPLWLSARRPLPYGGI